MPETTLAYDFRGRTVLDSQGSSLGSVKNTATARKPPKKGIVGIVAGGLGAAAMAKRRNAAKQGDEMPTPPVSHVEASAADGRLTVCARPGQPPGRLISPQLKRNRSGRNRIMEIPKEQILQTLRDRGDHDQAQQADQTLPDQVDPEQHKDLLGQVGVDPGELLGGLGGKLGL